MCDSKGNGASGQWGDRDFLECRVSHLCLDWTEITVQRVLLRSFLVVCCQYTQSLLPFGLLPVVHVFIGRNPCMDKHRSALRKEGVALAAPSFMNALRDGSESSLTPTLAGSRFRGRHLVSVCKIKGCCIRPFRVKF